MVSKNDLNVTTMDMQRHHGLQKQPKCHHKGHTIKESWSRKNNPKVTTKGMSNDITVSKNDPNVTTKGIPKETMVSKNNTKVTTKSIQKGTLVSKNDPNIPQWTC